MASSEVSAPQRARGVKVVVATTVMLSFVSFWRAAAIVLSDLASSAYYAGGIAETAIGKSAPWFILSIMLFSYAVRAIYIESCSMFVRGGVYKVVHEAMGGTLAKFSVSALMFDYVLTGPISAVSAGLYLAGLINETEDHFHIVGAHHVSPPLFAAGFAVIVTLYFWRKNIIGMRESSENALRIMQITTVMVVILIAWCVITMVARGFQPVPLPRRGNLSFGSDALGWLKGTASPQITFIAVLIGLGHSLLAMSGEESLAQVTPQLLPITSCEVRHYESHHQLGRWPATAHDSDQPGERDTPGGGVRVRSCLEFCDEGAGCSYTALQAACSSSVESSTQRPNRGSGMAGRTCPYNRGIVCPGNG